MSGANRIIRGPPVNKAKSARSRDLVDTRPDGTLRGQQFLPLFFPFSVGALLNVAHYLMLWEALSQNISDLWKDNK